MKTQPSAINEAFAAIAHAARKLRPDVEHAERAARIRAEPILASAADLSWLAAYDARERARMAIQMVVRGKCYATGEDVEELTRLAIRSPDDSAVAGLRLHDASARYRTADRAMANADRQ